MKVRVRVRVGVSVRVRVTVWVRVRVRVGVRVGVWVRVHPLLFSIMQSEPRSRKSCTSFSCLGSVGAGVGVRVGVRG